MIVTYANLLTAELLGVLHLLLFFLWNSDSFSTSCFVSTSRFVLLR